MDDSKSKLNLTGDAAASCWKVPISRIPVVPSTDGALGNILNQQRQRYYQLGEEARPHDAYEYHETKFTKTLVYPDFAITTRYPNNIVLVKKLGICKVEEIELQTEMVYDEVTQTSSESIVQPPKTIVYVSPFKKQSDIFLDNHPCKSSEYNCFIVSGGVKEPKLIQTADIINQIVLLLIRDEETEKIIVEYAAEAAANADPAAGAESDQFIGNYNSNDVSGNAEDDSSDDDPAAEHASSTDDDDEESVLESVLLVPSVNFAKIRRMNKKKRARELKSGKKFKELSPIVFNRMTLKKSVEWIAQPLLHASFP